MTYSVISLKNGMRRTVLSRLTLEKAHEVWESLARRSGTMYWVEKEGDGIDLIYQFASAVLSLQLERMRPDPFERLMANYIKSLEPKPTRWQRLKAYLLSREALNAMCLAFGWKPVER